MLDITLLYPRVMSIWEIKSNLDTDIVCISDKTMDLDAFVNFLYYGQLLKIALGVMNMFSIKIRQITINHEF